MSSLGLRGRRHRSVGERRKAWQRKCQAAMGLDWPTITQCRDQYRRYLATQRAQAKERAAKKLRELAKRDRYPVREAVAERAIAHYGAKPEDPAPAVREGA